ncbi:fatty acid oxidation complex subunit alpha FadB [Neptuniibacter sp. CAU 1671]|uniref:fatty acid oxidation complex subunit alpha FadB n=1 Tax=Neptuniibacter sp. CAU 1671 TaxID=3032593 RepID=UPI0023DC9710|nr:fatty acid oxidation complex subunit alpha FadB [Neptuniibacter sp. CAU 1671]MDF2182830.1 fatty acid oxidation complex subunit alpha FadB [Neptuniibacter sp. CAU 1671]
MLFDGQAIHLKAIGEGIYDLVIDHKEAPVNTIDQATLEEIRQAITALEQLETLHGLLISSAKESFVVGADITEFLGVFALPEETIVSALMNMHPVFNALEYLPCPTVAAINGLCLGGGFELCLAADYRVLGEQAKVGLPETKLGLYPGWGGTVRLPRLIGVDNALEWIGTGAEKKAAAALNDGAVDAVVPTEQVRAAALELLHACMAGEFDYQARRREKTEPIKLSQMEQMMAFETAKGLIAAKAGPHYPAPMAALKTIQAQAGLSRDQAQAVEAKGFAKVAKSDTCTALVSLFMKDHHIKKVARAYERKAQPVGQAAVLGAGIMGGGIAYQSASRGVPILMKDIRPEAIKQGLDEAGKLLQKRVEAGKTSVAQMSDVLNSISPTLSYGDFAAVDLAVEAVVEHPKIKKAVLAEVETHLSKEAVLTSNTSTISITDLASVLQRPENFCGMHFFNPVHKMPLVEVIRGKQTSDQTVAQTVAYALKMGKTPIVVNDCPGFLVNRILFPYFCGFVGLIADGCDFARIDRVMEAYGWPMGPAYLLDVVGIDTAHHADRVMSAGYPQRMAHTEENVIDRMFSLNRLGQKNGLGFYRYALDRKGRPQKQLDESLPPLLADLISKDAEISDEMIIERMMIPLCIETARCLEEGIVSHPAEADMALILGIGYPPFRGGPLHYLDQMGLQAFCDIAAKYSTLGPLYQPTDTMQTMAAQGKHYFR